MIRRPNTVNGHRGWLLITQIQHAQIAERLAKEWGAAAGFLPVDDSILIAIRHHDDGWADWDSRFHPHVGTNRPIEFDEMSWEDTCPIWSQSIEIARRLGSLEGFVVAQHFLKLLRSSHRAVNFEGFARNYETLCDQWLGEWISYRPENTTTKANLAVDQLRFFDWLSLWLCCEARTDPAESQTPEGRNLVLTPEFNDRNTIVADPWPWLGNEFFIMIKGFELAIDRSPTDDTDIPPQTTESEIRLRIRPRRSNSI